MAQSLGFYGDGISLRIVFGQSFWLTVLPGGAHIAQPMWMPMKRILGGGQTRGVSFWPFPNSSGWWWLISSMFLTSTSCCKTAQSDGYCCAWNWPGWAVLVSVLPLTLPTFSPSICHGVMWPDAMILVFWLLSFKPAFLLSSRGFLILHFLPLVVSSAYLKWLTFLLAILIPARDSSILVFHMMYSA